MITKSSILQAAADRRAKQAEEAKRRAELAAAKAWRAANREAVKAAQERNRRERDYYRDVKLVRRYEGCQRALENALASLGKREGAARDTQRAYVANLRAAIERDALAVAEAMARVMEYEAAAERERLDEFYRQNPDQAKYRKVS